MTHLQTRFLRESATYHMSYYQSAASPILSELSFSLSQCIANSTHPDLVLMTGLIESMEAANRTPYCFSCDKKRKNGNHHCKFYPALQIHFAFWDFWGEQVSSGTAHLSALKLCCPDDITEYLCRREEYGPMQAQQWPIHALEVHETECWIHGNSGAYFLLQ